MATIVSETILRKRYASGEYAQVIFVPSSQRHRGKGSSVAHRKVTKVLKEDVAVEVAQTGRADCLQSTESSATLTSGLYNIVPRRAPEDQRPCRHREFRWHSLKCLLKAIVN